MIIINEVSQPNWYKKNILNPNSNPEIEINREISSHKVFWVGKPFIAMIFPVFSEKLSYFRKYLPKVEIILTI